MSRILQKSLIDALSYACVRELPPVDTGEEVWIYAIALVSKRDGSKSYAILKRNDSGENALHKDFGSVSIIAGIDEVYPYLYLDSSYVPNFTNRKKEEMVNWLSLMCPGGTFDDMSVKELKKEVIAVAVRNQLRSINNTNSK